MNRRPKILLSWIVEGKNKERTVVTLFEREAVQNNCPPIRKRGGVGEPVPFDIRRKRMEKWTSKKKGGRIGGKKRGISTAKSRFGALIRGKRGFVK